MTPFRRYESRARSDKSQVGLVRIPHIGATGWILGLGIQRVARPPPAFSSETADISGRSACDADQAMARHDNRKRVASAHGAGALGWPLRAAKAPITDGVIVRHGL